MEWALAVFQHSLVNITTIKQFRVEPQREGAYHT